MSYIDAACAQIACNLQKFQPQQLLWQSAECINLHKINLTVQSICGQTIQIVVTLFWYCVSSQVEDWAGSSSLQGLLLADWVIWTRAATGSLQQLAAGDHHALRGLADSAVLQLETVTTALRRYRQTAESNKQQNQKTADCGAQSQAATAGQSVVRSYLEVERKDGGCQQAAPSTPKQQQQTRRSTGDRPATPDAVELQPDHGPCGTKTSSNKSSSSSSSINERHLASPESSCGVSEQPSISSRASLGMSSGIVCCAGANNKYLTRQQLLGLQLLVAAGTCHREVAAALVAAGVQGASDFEWGQQLRLYWQAEEGQLQVRLYLGLLRSLFQYLWLQQCNGLCH